MNQLNYFYCFSSLIKVLILFLCLYQNHYNYRSETSETSVDEEKSEEKSHDKPSIPQSGNPAFIQAS